MSVLVVTLLAIGVFLALAAVEVPIGLALAIAGTLGIALLEDPSIAARVLASAPFNVAASFGLLAIPMYILLGSLLANCGVGEQIFRSANRMVGRFPGGLGATVIVAITMFSGISGTSAADVATFGKVSVVEMVRHGYSKAYAAAVVASGAAAAVLIPPSVVLIIYGVVAEQPIGDLLLAGILPGVISCLALTAFVVCRSVLEARRSPAPAPVASHDPGPGAPSSEGRFSDLVGAAYAAILFAIVLGGIYTGIFTATEAGAVGALAAFVIAVTASPTRRPSIATMLKDSFGDAARVTSMVFLILTGASIFTYFMSVGRLPIELTEWATDLAVSPKLVAALLLIAMLPLGMFLDGLSILVLVAPLAVPVVTDLGMDGVWFGVMMVMMIEVGLITPPVGTNVFVISGIVKDLDVADVFRAITPFIVLELALAALFFLFPGIVTWLPSLAAG